MNTAKERLEAAVEPILSHMEQTAATMAPADSPELGEVMDTLARLRAVLSEVGK